MKSNVATLNSEAEVIVDKNNDLVEVVPDSQRYLTNRLGYKIKIKDNNGKWLDRISIVDDNGGAIHINEIGSIKTNDDELNSVIESIIERDLSIYLPISARVQIEYLKIIAKEFNSGKNDIYTVLRQFLTRAASNHYGKTITASTAAGVSRKLVAYLVAYEYPNLTLEQAEEVAGVKVGSQLNHYSKLFLMNDAFGPFTREEMGIIQHALDDDALEMPLDSRIIVQLCVEWGLRPGQISLLKESDFHYNPQNDIFWLNVPRVKQKQRNRRTQFKKRLLSNRLGQLIRAMIDSTSWIKSYYGINDAPLFQRRFEKFVSEDDDGLIKINDAGILNPHKDKYGIKKMDFSFHLPTEIIISRIHQIERFLPLSPRTGMPFNLTAYRFRYTLGTASVTQGMTAVEVAERLDHSGTENVRHYFKNTEHLWEVIQDATTSRIEQGHFVAKFMTKDLKEKNIYSVDITERKTFTSIGKCHKGSACSLEPAVACYGCTKFQPNNNTEGHKKAKEVIVAFRELAQSHSSTGEIQHVFDDALVGVEAAIVFSERPEDVLGITDCEPREINSFSLVSSLSLENDNE